MSSKARSPSVRGQQVPEPTVELIVLHRPAQAISPWWQRCQIISSFICTISGIATCIALGRIETAFGDECIIYGEISIDRQPSFSEHIRSRHLNTTVKNWGMESDCSFCQFFPMSGACASIIMGVLFLEFGSTDTFLRSRKSSLIDNTWKIVVPGIIVSLVFFILSSVALANTVGGLLSFCEHVLQFSSKDLNLTSCFDVYQLPWEINPLSSDVPNEVNVYANFLISEIGASLHFVGWFLSLMILLVRCGSSVDFVTVRRKKFRKTEDSTETFPVVFDEEEEDDAPLFIPAESSGTERKKSEWSDESSSTETE